jgi:transcriptional regulator with XRE-family HTH domain
VPQLTTGVPALDDLIDGVRVGDNLVVLADTRDVLHAVATAFLEAVADPAVIVCTDGAVTDGADRDPPARRVDWTAGGGVGELPAARDELTVADDAVGEGASFLVDTLTGVQDRWGADAALEVFLGTCPRLYRHGSVAMWLLERDRHDRAFLDRLREITQVVVDVRTTEEGGLEAEVLTAAGRPDPTVGRRVGLELGAEGLVAAGPMAASRLRLGAAIRSQRTTRGLGQAELARRIGISPSALSQVERGVRGLSADSLIRIWEVLGVPFGPGDTHDRGYRVVRRATHGVRTLAAGVTGELRVDDPTVGQVWAVTVAPGASGRHPLFEGKATEVVLVEAGALDLEVGGHPETLQDGDALVCPGAVIAAWANPTGEPVRLVWALLR